MALAEASSTAAAERASGSSFYNAMRILPRAQRAAMFEIYSFCRQVDDIADASGPRDARRAELERWRADIDALSTMLGDKPYLFGEAPTSYDASLYGILANVLAFPKDGVLATHVRTKPNLVAFVDRVRETYWATPDTEA